MFQHGAGEEESMKVCPLLHLPVSTWGRVNRRQAGTMSPVILAQGRLMKRPVIPPRQNFNVPMKLCPVTRSNDKGCQCTALTGARSLGHSVPRLGSTAHTIAAGFCGDCTVLWATNPSVPREQSNSRGSHQPHPVNFTQFPSEAQGRIIGCLLEFYAHGDICRGRFWRHPEPP